MQTRGLIGQDTCKHEFKRYRIVGYKGSIEFPNKGNQGCNQLWIAIVSWRGSQPSTACCSLGNTNCSKRVVRTWPGRRPSQAYVITVPKNRMSGLHIKIMQYRSVLEAARSVQSKIQTNAILTLMITETILKWKRRMLRELTHHRRAQRSARTHMCAVTDQLRIETKLRSM